MICTLTLLRYTLTQTLINLLMTRVHQITSTQDTIHLKYNINEYLNVLILGILSCRTMHLFTEMNSLNRYLRNLLIPCQTVCLSLYSLYRLLVSTKITLTQICARLSYSNSNLHFFPNKTTPLRSLTFGLLKISNSKSLAYSRELRLLGAWWGCSLIAVSLQAPFNPPVVIRLKKREREKKREKGWTHL